MTEEYLHHVWKYRLFDERNLATTNGEKIFISQTGIHNSDAGPDFFNGLIRIGSTKWAGNIEIHIHSSDWRKHRHHTDPAYNNVILHVVFIHDESVYDSNNRMIPVLELKNRVDISAYEKFQEFIWSRSEFPCFRQQEKIPSVLFRSQFDRVIADRIERKIQPVRRDVAELNNNWEEVCYRTLARNFGFRVNAMPFEWLSRNTPLHLVKKSRGDVTSMEALFFGQAGFLDRDRDDAYFSLLKSRYAALKENYGLSPIEKPVWKFSRMRPVNFPTVRLAQLAMLLHTQNDLMRLVTENLTSNEIRKSLMLVPSDYWCQHYSFSRVSRMRFKRFGQEAADNLIINSIVPLMFCYGRDKGLEHYCERAMILLEETAPERNYICGKWSARGMKAINALDSQSQIEMWNNFCSRKKCLNCSIGNHLLKHNDRENSRLF